MWAAPRTTKKSSGRWSSSAPTSRARTDGGFTPLLFASRAGKIDTVSALLAAGADVNDALAPAAKDAPAAPPVSSGAGNTAGVAPGGNHPADRGRVGSTAPAPSCWPWPTSTGLSRSCSSSRAPIPTTIRSGWSGLHELSYQRRGPNVGKGLPPQEDVEHIDTLGARPGARRPWRQRQAEAQRAARRLAQRPQPRRCNAAAARRQARRRAVE